MRVRRGVGSAAIDAANPITQSASGAVAGAAASYGPSISQLGITADDWFERNFDEPLTCAEMRATGADLSGTTCATSGMPSWVIPAAIGGMILIFLLPPGRSRR